MCSGLLFHEGTNYCALNIIENKREIIIIQIAHHGIKAKNK